MANNYEQIMALVNAGNKMGLSNTITRDNGIPLDLSSVYSSYNDAVVYAATKAIAYHGQPIAVITANDATLYVITPVSQGTVEIDGTSYDVYLKQVGAKTLGDEQSIVLDDNGVLSLYGFEAAGDATLPRKNPVTGTLEWVSIDRIVTGDGNTKTIVAAAEGADITVTPSYDEANDTYTYTLGVTLPEIPEYSVAKADGEGVTTYTVTKDGVAVGEAIVVPDAYNDAALAARVSAVEDTVNEDHESRIENLEAFFKGAAADEGEGESLVNALDTLKEIQAYIAADGEVSEKVIANEAAIVKLNGTGDGSVTKTVNDAIAAQAATDAANYATKDALADVKATADAAAVKTEVESALAGKVDNTALDNYYLKTETYSQTEIADLIAGITGDSDETVESVLSKLTAAEAANAAKFSELEGKNATQDNAIQANADAIAAINNAETGLLAQAASAAQAKVDTLANGTVKQNAADIAALTKTVEGTNKTVGEHTTKLGALEQADNDLSSRIDALSGAHDGLNATIAQHSIDIQGLKDKDVTIEAAVAANTAKFAEYYTTKQVDDKIAAIDHTAITDAIAVNAKAIQDEASRADTEEKRLAGLIQDNADDILANAGEIARLEGVINAAIENEDGTALNSIKELASWVSEHETEVLPAIEANTEAIEKLNGDVNTEGSVKKAAADAVAAIPMATSAKAGLVMASDEVTVAADGRMGLGTVSTDKLIQGSLTFVLNGGSAEVVSA